ncbi:RNA polymerase II subunit A C-terminal domain phosphatase [Trichonephila inaurata madagascariensis]|uniref:RNA polymerase II subunit A C-terminal domain phosphatase n=1 Tax=Trichonephila inaurata madagascariensis TaxID=2747483 RepID=A0A8X7BQX7_9ARAC|nr:RNA polymerase II subunit A C-terminal domain phosphatase [Trichonephila inaurata madagascariensis]
MSSSSNVYRYDGKKPFTLVKWKIQKGSQLFYNSVILSYKQDGDAGDGKELLLKYKSSLGGSVMELIQSEGKVVQPGAELLKIEPCTHPVIMKDLCAECGADLRDLDRDNFEKLTAETTFSMVHIVPELKVSLQQAEELGKDDETRLLKNRKLVLLVDLDQTLIHTTNDNVPEELPDVFHFQLYGSYSPWYHTKLRPGTVTFLENISKYYELHICTFGARLYAHKIAKILDPKGTFFSHRILSRDECFDATSKTGNLKGLFPRGDNMVCIIDDREDVWNFAPNVIHVKPYSYFRNTGDINAPPPSSPPQYPKDQSVKTQSSPAQSPAQDQPANPAIQPSQNLKQAQSAKPIKQPSPVENLIQDQSSNPVTQPSSSQNPIQDHSQNSKENNRLTDTEIAPDESLKNTEDSKIMVNANANEVTNCSVISDASSNVDKDLTEKEKLTETQNSAIAPETFNVTVGSKTSEESTKNNSNDLNKVENNSSPKSAENVNNSASGTADLYCATNETDDYLLYLEEILIKIHHTFYDLFEKINTDGVKTIPDLKEIVPSVRRNVLKNVNIVFSSVIPTNCVPENHHIWTLAESLGARVFKDLHLEKTRKKTTHIISSKPGTAKVNAARRQSDIHIVTLDWLFCCAERWERVDEKLFQLPKELPTSGDSVHPFNNSAVMKSRFKRTHGSKKKLNEKEQLKKEKEDKFSERIFVEAGLSLSKEDIEDMEREINASCSDESDDENSKSASSDSSSSSVESLSSGDYPRGWKKRKKCDPEDVDEEIEREPSESSDADTIGSVDEEIAEAVKQEFGNF